MTLQTPHVETYDSFVEFLMEGFEMSRDTIERATKLAMQQARKILGHRVDFANPEDCETLQVRVALVLGARMTREQDRSEW